jgi:acetylornithine deacetylase
MSYQLIDNLITEEQELSALADDALLLLKELISTPSLSKEEDKTASIIRLFLNKRGVETKRLYNNIWAFNKYYDANKPTILLNSHHDTVKPNEGYLRDPYCAEIIEDKLFGLGSNDAGGCLVSLLAVFLHFYSKNNLSYNLCFSATAEEENTGMRGLKSILPEIGKIDCAIVGEPTQMQMATAEMGCMVLDCCAHGKAGHAARNEGDNALYKAMADILWLSTFHFPKRSAFMGPVKMTVTEIHAGIQHNIVPAECHFTVDVRLNDCYTTGELLAIIKNHTASDVFPRSSIVKTSCIDQTHPLIRAGQALGRKSYLSPTTSDRGWLDVPSLKMGPGNSARSHMANEYIYVHEISEGIRIYTGLLKSMLHHPYHPENYFSGLKNGN